MKLLVRIKDKTPRDGWEKSREGRIRAGKLQRRGEVVCELKETDVLGDKTINNPDWVIINTDAPDADCMSLLRKEEGNELLDKFLNRKNLYLDLDKLGIVATNDEIFIKSKDFLEAIKKRKRKVDPDQIGGRNGN